MTVGAVLVDHLETFFEWVSENDCDRASVLVALDGKVSHWRRLADDEAAEVAEGIEQSTASCADVLRFYEAARTMVSNMATEDA